MSNSIARTTAEVDGALNDREVAHEITRAQRQQLRRFALGQECPYCHTRNADHLQDNNDWGGLDITHLCINPACVDDDCGQQWSADDACYVLDRYAR